tara:strand:+ start:17039 stop:18070 length:1032 start_codon:yes stop_codon:yes gene_type:complete
LFKKILLIALSLSTTGFTQIALASNSEKKADTREEDTPKPTPKHCLKPENDLNKLDQTSWFDKTHAKVSVGLCRQVNNIDGFFGQISEDENAQGFLRIRNGIQWLQLDENTVEYQPSIKARVRLPNISKKLHLLITDDDEERNTIPSSKNYANKSLSKETSRLGKLLGIDDADPVDYDFDVGFKSDDGPRLFTRARATFQLWPSADSNLRLSQSVFWLDGLGYGEETLLEYNQTLSDITLFRWVTAAEYSEETEGLRLEQNLIFFQQLDQKRGLSYRMQMLGHTRPTLNVVEYGFHILYRRNFLKPWLYYELEPSVYWPLEIERDMALRMVFRVEVQLGQQIK